VVVGDSAGGGLALATLAAAQRDAIAGRGVGALAGVLISPWTDLGQTGASIVDRADADPLLTQALLSASAQLYLDGHPVNDQRASPLFGEPLRLPPLTIHVGTHEILLDDTLRYVARAERDGTPVTAHVWEGMPHVFLRNVGIFAAATAALDLVGEFVSSHITQASTVS
jgi:acetyl esterase/lipase